jgi:hypothetical protein
VTDSHEITVTLDTPVPAEQEGELRRRIFFVSAEITGFETLATAGKITSVVLRSGRPLDHEELARKLGFVIANDLAGQRYVPARVIWVSPHHRVCDDSVYSRLRASGQVAEVGEGQVAFGEPLIMLADWFDAQLTGIVEDEFGSVRHYRYPTLIPTRVLEAAGYFSSFPQYLMFVTRLHSDVDVYRGFQAQYRRDGRLTPEVLGYCRAVDYCLPPTMCFHTFGHYRGSVVGEDGLEVVTAKGKSFRFESRYATTLERLWDFTIREIVFLGDRAEVLEARQRLMDRVFAFITDLGLAGECEVGNDPFFCEPDGDAGRIPTQRMMELKYELRLQVSDTTSIAVGSFNFHDNFFGQGFAITRPGGEHASSGCAGFGIERLVHAFLCQYGTDQAAWPAALAKVRTIDDSGS